MSIPAEHGQIWKKYNILPYTSRVTNSATPQRAVQDWILLETGFDIWHAEIPAMLNVAPDCVNVYHTPEVQKQIEGVIARFVNVDPMVHQFRVSVFSVGSPLWRQKIPAGVEPIRSESLGSQAWVVLPDALRSLLEIFRAQHDFVNHTAETRLLPNGQPMRIYLARQREYTRDVFSPVGSGKPPQPELVRFDDGFGVEVMPLVSIDGLYADAQIKMHVNHLDRVISMRIVPLGSVGKVQSEEIETPVVGQFRFRERYQWSLENSLLVSVGITPPLTSAGSVSGLNLLNSTKRVETLVLIEYRKLY
ncbi:MAG: hypothetical protein Q4D38_12590 [Planctomycetia bacterium]|nr:hypothetical protein [Planctomycetia bacterium]